MRTLLSLIVLAFVFSVSAVNIDFRQVNTNHFTTNGLNPGTWQLSIRSNIISGSGGSSTQAVNILDGFTLTPASNATNYWWDFGKTNASGERLIYGTLSTASNVCFLGVTNCVRWRLLSFNIIAQTNILISIPNNLPNFVTNNGFWAGFTNAGGRFTFTLTNGSEFRMTLQSNNTLSTLWTTFGQ